MKYREQMREKGFEISGTSPDGSLAELVELRDHPYFLACQYHPEFQSKPNKPHPLFKGFVQACLERQSQTTASLPIRDGSMRKATTRDIDEIIDPVRARTPAVIDP